MSMPALALPRSAPIAAPRDLLAPWRGGDAAFLGLGLLLLFAMLPTGFAALADERSFLGLDIWEKPLKFELALAIYALTLALFARLLPTEWRSRTWFRLYRGAVIAAILAELAWIGGAAFIGTASHFNGSPLGQAVYPVMGVLATLLTSVSAVFAWAIVRNPRPGVSPALKEGVVLGLALVLPLTLVTAGTMSGMGSHFVGGTGTDAGGLFLLGWSRTGGDLRAPHFLATHAMHFIPAFGLLSERLWGPWRLLPTRIFAAGFVLLVAYAFATALMGKPFLPFLG